MEKDMSEKERPLDEIAYEYFEQAEQIRKVLAVRDTELSDELNRTENAFDNKTMADTEYYAKKAELNARFKEVEQIRKDLELLAPQERRNAHLIGRNGTIAMWLGKDHSVWVETDGVKTVAFVDPTVHEVEKWKRILGIH